MERPVRILAIDDEETMLRILKRSLEPEGYSVETYLRADEALRRLESVRPRTQLRHERHPAKGGITKPSAAVECGAHDVSGAVDVVITDLMMPDTDGFKVIERVRTVDQNIMIIVLTAYSSVESAVKAIKTGAYDFIPKPFDPEHLLIIVRRAIEARNLRLENIGLKRRLDGTDKEIIGNSGAMRYVFSMIEKVKDTDGTVLLIGESGVGKELVAKEIHFGSKRREHPFIPVNCGALPDELLESELFGYEKGAFTGAVNRKIGLFEAADKGTVFLDEVSSISPMMQVKLLRFLQERSFMRLGGKDLVSVDVRVIAATNEDLKESVDKGYFRKDLYYRLNVIPIEIPPLRERKDDIPLLIRHFIRRFSMRMQRNITITRDAEEALIKYRWEGNVRELENLIERAMTITDDDTIGLDDLPPEILKDKEEPDGKTTPYPDDLTLAEVERLHIKNILKATDGNKSRAARKLGIDYTTLLRKLKSMGMGEV